jgi:hypothetical protein
MTISLYSCSFKGAQPHQNYKNTIFHCERERFSVFQFYGKTKIVEATKNTDAIKQLPPVWSLL